MNKQIDFKDINARLLTNAESFCSQWLQGGKRIGNEYVCSNIKGGNGNSFSVNLNTGVFCDFADERFKGGDLISLYAMINGISQTESAQTLYKLLDISNIVPSRLKVIDFKITRPPLNIPTPSMVHSRFGSPSFIYPYKDKDGLLFYVCRYETNDGKMFCSWSWSSAKNSWVAKSYPIPRPIFGLELVQSNPDKPVLIVEGEKSTICARTITSDYVVVSWPNGSNSWDKTDWTPLYGRNVTIWPDADDPGIKAANGISKLLSNHCPEVKIITPTGRGDGWDIADAIKEGMSWDNIKDWYKDKISIVTNTPTTVNITVNTDDSYDGTPNINLWSSLGLSTTNSGTPDSNVDNVVRVLEQHAPFNNLLWYDEFHCKYLTKWNSNSDRQWTDIDELNLMFYLQRALGLRKITDDIVHKACVVYANRNIRNEPKEWMESLKWDGEERVGLFLVEALGCDESEYSFYVSRNFWVSMIARILEPGCQVDSVMVLEGSEGLGKTNALRTIAGKWYVSLKRSGNHNISNDFFMSLQGKLIAEIAELDAFRGAESTLIKQVITDKVDSFRRPYAKAVEDHPRMSIFVGTTNEKSYLKDNSGKRRWWPIFCRKINIDYIKQHREQLFAEAVMMYKSGIGWYEMPAEDTKREQESRRITDEWEYIIGEWVSNRTETTVNEIAKECLNIDIGKLERKTQMRIGAILHRLKWEKHFSNNSDHRGNVWYPPETIPF